MSDWFKDATFWAAARPVMFTAARMSSGEEDVENLLARLGIPSPVGVHVLDMPSGPGRHSLPLARAGAAVTAVDLNAAYLETLRAQSAGLTLTLIEGDMRDVPLPSDTFQLALNLYSSIGYFREKADDQRVFRRVFEALKPSGWLVIDTLSLETIARRFKPVRFHEVDGLVVEERMKILDGWAKVETTLRLRRERQHRDLTFEVWLYSAYELRQMLREVGFTRVDTYGDYNGLPFDAEARRLVIFAQK